MDVTVVNALIAFAGVVFTGALVPLARWGWLTWKDRREAKKALRTTQEEALQTVESLKTAVEKKNNELAARDDEERDLRAAAAHWYEEAERWRLVAARWREEAELTRQSRQEQEGSS